MIFGFYDGGKSVDTVAHICIATDNIDGGK